MIINKSMDNNYEDLNKKNNFETNEVTKKEIECKENKNDISNDNKDPKDIIIEQEIGYDMTDGQLADYIAENMSDY